MIQPFADFVFQQCLVGWFAFFTFVVLISFMRWFARVVLRD